MSEELTYEQKSNMVKELSSCYDEKDNIEICDHEKMKNIMDYKLNIDLEIIKGIFESDFKKTKIEDDDFEDDIFNTATSILNGFYEKHPFLIPFVGKNYSKAKPQYLYVLESHYLPDSSRFYKLHYNKLDTEDKKNKWLKEQWYKKDFKWSNLKQFNENIEKSPEEKAIFLHREDIEYMWTESVVKNNIKYNNRFKALFENMLNIKKEEIERAVKSIAFMNYFLRPSEDTGVSIKYEYIDSLFSYLNLIRVWEALGKPYIIICSAKVRNSFNGYWKKHNKISSNSENIIPVTSLCLCNHPSNMSWKRKIDGYKNNEEKLKTFIESVENSDSKNT
ncbi:hypothetical protein [Faecalitalea cylindroides]|uniref:Uncharacterized protein n=2 Tax=Faecalitalea cylindroides TaxID=39483 RepID=A0AAW6FU06_9FIRM|nr:hypothetical protein [Faecalitalea cylindroides]MDC0828214.1 hypothetical protein [Faecalitalea cylindroides]